MRRTFPPKTRFGSPAAYSLALLFAALMSGCASRAALPTSSASLADAPRVAAGPESPADWLPDVDGERIAAIHRSKCGSCHMPVEPGSLHRDNAEAAMQRHRRRAKLTERDWAAMVEFLSADGALHARHTARVP